MHPALRHPWHTTKRGLLTACLLALSACALPLPPTAPTEQVWSGRLGLQVHDPLAQDQSFSAAFQLQGDAQQGRLDIFNPLGSQMAQLQWQPGTAWLIQGDHHTQSDSLATLLQQSLGTALPIQALFAWLRGDNAAAAGWSVDLSKHAQGRITAQRTQPLPQATLRVVLQQPE